MTEGMEQVIHDLGEILLDAKADKDKIPVAIKRICAIPEILNLFKAEVDKLTVIHADGCATNLGIIGATCNCGSESQLQHTKNELDLMGE